ncbi:hypothetical protein MYA_2519 [Burkholderia sp. KJ006]|nr:hypothetical protein MYA_2519 [Burkholderia sp. KJ006]
MFQCVHHACGQAARGSERRIEPAAAVPARRVRSAVAPASAGFPACVMGDHV